MQAKWYLLDRFSRIFSLPEVAEIFINLFICYFQTEKLIVTQLNTEKYKSISSPKQVKPAAFFRQYKPPECTPWFTN